MNFNPIQMGPEFTSWYMSDVEIKIRDMVNALHAGFIYHEVPIERIDLELKLLGLKYEDLPQSCKDMIDELDVC